MDQTTGRAHYLENFPGADVTAEELEFLRAMERFQRRHRRRYPTWREVLFVLKSLGYRRVQNDEDRNRRAAAAPP